MANNAVSVGRIVHYVAAEGKHVPAIIVRVWSPTCLNLRVFSDSTDVPGHFTSVSEDPEGKQTYTWHWPEFVT